MQRQKKRDSMFKTVRTKLMVTFFVFTFLCLAIAFANFQYSQYKERISNTTELLNNANTTFLNQVKVINDFFDYETKNPTFYETNQSQFLLLYDNKKEILKEKIKALRIESHFGFDLDYDLNLLTDKLKEFDSIFTKMAEISKQKGFKDFGLEGEMRRNIHKLEYSKKADMVLILTLRRHEKDYIIRNEPKYVEEHRAAAAELEKKTRNSSTLSPEEKDSLILLLHNYTKAFAKYVEAEKTLGFQNNTGLKKELDAQISEIQSELINMNVDTEKTKTFIFEHLNLYISIVVISLLGISVYLGLFFSRKMTEDISKLSANIDLFVGSGFTDTTTISTKKDDEIGVLINNYLTMKEETVSLINDFKQKVEERTAEINQKSIEIQLQKEEIETQRDHLFEKNAEINSQKEKTERHNKSMLDSIIYAKRIQESMLPPATDIKHYFSDGFVLYMPKDIISGDFYTINSVHVDRVEKILVAAADCTGHGVPGALMSMMAISLLNEIVSKEHVSDTAEILNKLRTNVVKSLHKGKAEKVSNDGLDIALCMIDKKNMKAEFAGANRPLYLMRNQELEMIRGDKMPIGNFVTQNKSFQKVEFDLKPDDRIYLFTDGYTDQFGGSANRKYMNKRFRDLIMENHLLTMEQQEQNFRNTHNEWKGERAQLDDILVIGIEIKA